eukprot:gene13227-9073_t
MLQNNPFLAQEKGSAGQQSSSIQLADSSKLLADEIRRDDAAMSKELAALAPRSSRFYRLQQKEAQQQNGLHAMRNEDAVAAVEVHEKVTMDEFIAKKREVGLVHMSLATKRSEIRKLDEEIDCAEKKLHQQQEQLENTREKFNNFLKHSNLEQDAAVRRADAETKAKQSKKVEIKKLSARINHIELEIRKAEVQVETCKMYKKFLDDLAKPRWFFDVLIDLRVADQMDEILMHTESEFEHRSAILKKNYEKEVALREEKARALEGANKFRKFSQFSEVEEDEQEEELVPLETQLEQLHQSLENKAQQRVQEVTEQTKEEVNALTVEEVREILENNYDENRKPTYYTDVEQLLDVFINVEEGNLFLIQNCQELEEELERVATEYLGEKNETMAMTKQRHAQMLALAEKIRAAQQKMKQLEQRFADLEKHVPSQVNPADKDKPVDPKAPPEELTPEQFKVEVEKIITRIFRTLSAGDTIIKSLSSVQHTTERETEDNFGFGAEEPASPGVAAKKPKKVKKTGARAAPNGVAKSKDLSRKSTAPSNGSGSGNSDSSEAGSNMGPVEMLTIIENKLEEYHRYISDSGNGIEEALIQNVMKASDKERRRQARLIHMAKQAEEQEEKSRRALERSRAPVVRRTGKPVLPRSRLLKTDTESEGKQTVNVDSENDINEFLENLLALFFLQCTAMGLEVLLNSYCGAAEVRSGKCESVAQLFISQTTNEKWTYRQNIPTGHPLLSSSSLLLIVAFSPSSFLFFISYVR